jgi:hypothetical protein
MFLHACILRSTPNNAQWPPGSGANNLIWIIAALELWGRLQPPCLLPSLFGLLFWNGIPPGVSVSRRSSVPGMGCPARTCQVRGAPYRTRTDGRRIVFTGRAHCSRTLGQLPCKGTPAISCRIQKPIRYNNGDFSPFLRLWNSKELAPISGQSWQCLSAPSRFSPNRRITD